MIKRFLFSLTFFSLPLSFLTTPIFADIDKDAPESFPSSTVRPKAVSIPVEATKEEVAEEAEPTPTIIEEVAPASQAVSPVEVETPAPLLAATDEATDSEAGFVGTPPPTEEAGKLLPGGRVKMSGHYRLAAGVDSQDFILNDANADLQERNFRYLFGERQNNTYDPGIYSQYLLNVDFAPRDKWNIYTQIVVDPWSVTGTTGEQVIANQDGTSTFRPNFKYFGAFNSVINEIYRANTGDAIATPLTKVIDGHTTSYVTGGFTDFGTRYSVSELDIDYEFRPIRKLWAEYTEENWHFRAFAFADESQALTTDDPLGLSNHKDYWQQSPWLYQYAPVQFFTDGSIKRGHYSDQLSFLARDTAGNRLVLLRGASIEADLDRTYIAATVAAPYTPWDDDYFSADNIPGAIRIKHQATDKLMVGGVYTFRNGLIDDSIADMSQVVGVDGKYQLNDHVKFLGEIAGSHREYELMTNDRLKTSTEGYAYKAAVVSEFDHKMDGHTDFELSYTQMDDQFEPTLSRYTNTRDDHFWGEHISFLEYSPDLEYFRIGDGVDINRYVIRARWKEKLFKERFQNLLDIRNVHQQNTGNYKETVLRDEITYRVTQKLTAKTLFRWHHLPKTVTGVEPFIANYYVANLYGQDASFQNIDVVGGEDPSRFTYSGGLQYIFNKKWTAEGIVERTNSIPDFPRGLLNSTFRDANDRVDGLLIDHLTNFLYGQGHLGGVAPYEYFTIFREKLIFRPDERVTITFHAAQNSYKYAAGIDDNINHQGVSVNFDVSKKLSFFSDFTHSMQIDLPKLIATNYTEHDFRSHLNFYASMDYRLRPDTVFRAEYGVFGFGTNSPLVSPYSTTSFSLPTIDTEQLFRVSLTGDF